MGGDQGMAKLLDPPTNQQCTGPEHELLLTDDHPSPPKQIHDSAATFSLPNVKDQKGGDMEGDQNISRVKREPLPTDDQPFPKRVHGPNPTQIDANFSLSPSNGSKSHPISNMVRSYVKTTGFDRLLTTDIEGQQFQNYIEEIWSCLMDETVFRIGIHGIGGVGKTEVAKHIHNKLLQTPNKFYHVFWVEVSPDSGIRELQSCISDEAGLDLSDGDGQTKRARQLSKCLTGMRKSVLILDGVWDYIPLLEVGIPVGVDGCTVVFTTRSLGVCRRFGCKRKIEIRCLPPDESYELFKKLLGKEIILSSEVEKISRSVADRCVGLPLAITIMAGYMRGITDIWEWRNALRGNTQRKADTEIFQKLKVSYDCLKDPALQQCFLYCPLLFHEFIKGPFVGYSALKKSLLDNLVDGGIIKRTSSRKEVLGEAQGMVNFLRDAGLLEIPHSNEVQMNAFIRNMALQIMEENNQRAMIENHTYLKYMPGDESWTEDLVRVSLKGNVIESIPSTFSPSCSKLSTLLLRENHNLGYIGDKFFSGMPGLKVLDLSSTNIENLPSSISDLVNLTALILSSCGRLREFPSQLETLLALEKLDLSFSAVEGVAPKGIQNLSKLTYLDLRSTKVKLDLGLLKGFSHLQFLRLPWSCAANGEEVARLSGLEDLSCSFNDVVELNKCLVHLKEREAPRRLDVVVGPGPEYIFGFKDDKFFDEDYDYDFFAEENKDLSVVSFTDCSNINKVDMLIYFEEIVIVECNIDEGSLCSPIKGATEVKYISIRDCIGLQFLCSSSSLSEGQGTLEKVMYMELFKLEDLSVLFSCNEGNAPYYGSCFSNLTRFLIQGCPNIKRLFPFHLLPNLKNLERLYVRDCVSMVEIFAAEEKKEGENSSIVRYLPKLTSLEIVDLPVLERICGKGLRCFPNPRYSMKITNCPNVIKKTNGA